MDENDPRLLLARRLRALREERWPDLKITQAQLGQAMGQDRPLSVPLISSWESSTGPKIPPSARLDAYAALFATKRSFANGASQRIPPEAMTDGERREMGELSRELAQMRSRAMGAGGGEPRSDGGAEAVRLRGIAASLNSGPWRFADGDTITLVCAPFPVELRADERYTDRYGPDYIELYTYSELDALFELFGHLRAANPVNQVDARLTDRLARDSYTSHLVTLGGIDWNPTTRSVLSLLNLPVEQVAHWGDGGPEDDDVYFEVTEEDGRKTQHRPVFADIAGRRQLQFDVALFARAINPFNQERTVTICSGMYGRGTYGAVRALTDVRFRARNAELVRERFGDSESFCMIARVPVVDGATLTPDWTKGDIKLFEWSGE
jgi:transcriptional regulator with XRE-family HTH domain